MGGLVGQRSVGGRSFVWLVHWSWSIARSVGRSIDFSVLLLPCTFNDPGFTSNCSLCPPGTYSNISGATNCSLCPPGTYFNISGATNCLMCPLFRMDDVQLYFKSLHEAFVESTISYI